MNSNQIISDLKEKGNFRSIPADTSQSRLIDFSSNDYLGINDRADLRERFLASPQAQNALFSSSASRLLAANQDSYFRFEKLLSDAYKRDILTFNSGYHANSGLIPALCDSKTLILADRLVHASIIDGIMLSKCEFSRFRHNDINHLEQLIKRLRPTGDNILIIVESVYSMDGDRAPLDELIALKNRYPNIMLYVDEAHALGVLGRSGLGLIADSQRAEDVDVVIGTLGKAAGSVGAFAVMSPIVRDIAVNRARSFIFSTALPPINMEWSIFALTELFGMDSERAHLYRLSQRLADGLSALTGMAYAPSHIQPLIVGDSYRAILLSKELSDRGLKVLPIRTPTVPPGTERLRMSLSASMSADDIDLLIKAYRALL